MKKKVMNSFLYEIISFLCWASAPTPTSNLQELRHETNQLHTFIAMLLSAYCMGAEVGLFQSFVYSYFSKSPLKDFLDDINHSGKAIIEYSSNNLDTAKIITLTGAPATLGAVLQQVLKDQKISILEKTIRSS